MKRAILVAAVASAPLLIASGAAAQLTISSSTSTPVATATAVNGGPADINITTAGSIGLTSPGAAVTLNSSNNVSNAGSIGFTDVDNAIGILAQGGNTGSVTNTGTINITESYSPSDSNNDGLIDGNFASGGNRTGISVVGTAPLTGSITSTGTITVHGNASYGVSIAAPVTGDFTMLTVTPATSTTVASIVNGSISMLGNNTIGLYVAPTTSAGGPVNIGGNVNITSVSATGTGAQAVVVNGSVGGKLDISGGVTATGYRTTSRNVSPSLLALYTPQEITQGGSAVVIGGSVAGGVIVSAPPLVLSTTNLDLDNNGVPDSLQGTGAVSSYGSAPAMQIGVAGLTANLGTGAPNTSGYGLVIQGTVLGDGLFDSVTSPKLTGPFPATALQIGAPGATVAIAGGVHNTGAIESQSYQADSTAIHIQTGATIPQIVNDGVISANASQQTSATTGVTPLNVNGILIESGANVPSIVNNSGIVANITGSGGVGGAAGGIIDRSGSVTSVTNTGTINAILTQSATATPMPGSVTAIDLSQGTGFQTLTQSASATYASAAAYDATTTYAVGSIVAENGVVYQATSAVGAAVDPASNPASWREVGATSPFINGSIYLGNGGAAVNVTAGAVNAPTLSFGSGVSSITVNGTGAYVQGGLVQRNPGSSTLNVNVANGTLSNTSTVTLQSGSVNVGSTGVLLTAVDPNHPGNPSFLVSGSGANGSTFANGAQVGITLSSVQSAPTETYVVVETAPGGTLTAGTFGSGASDISPYLYTSTSAYVPATATTPAEITVTAGLKNQSQLGFNNAEYAALPAVLSALPNNTGIQSAVLAQTSLSGLRAVYDQLLPPQGQGLFDALDHAAESVSSLAASEPNPGTRVAGSSLWLQEVNERVRRTGLETQGSYAKLVGVVGGYERAGAGGGAFGLTLAYYNAEEADAAQATGGNVVASFVEAGAYYRRAIGGLTLAARGAGGYGWFSSERRFVTASIAEAANANWNGYFVDGHIGVGYERHLFGRFYARPEVSADYLRLDESAHTETGGGDGFDLHVADRASTRLSGQALMVLGAQFGKAQWLRTEVRAGYREVFAGDVGDTVANFTGGSVFSLAPDDQKGGWATVGLSLKGGSQYSYIALEGDADFRSGERVYDIRIAGRSIF